MELSIVEQRYRAVLEVQTGEPVVEVAARTGVSRQTIHSWLARYAEVGLVGLEDRSRRPRGCAHQASAEVEALVCELHRPTPRGLVAARPGRLAANPSSSTSVVLRRPAGLPLCPRASRRASGVTAAERQRQRSARALAGARAARSGSP
ncbi:helix-turn-helix domain-containing protein [Micromonospora chersina]|uniref:helix-turn-helix domain-containing protein n=1 Tax=Micromonospora chersina TaxID=47854 RepID=UPI0036CF8937